MGKILSIDDVIFSGSESCITQKRLTPRAQMKWEVKGKKKNDSNSTEGKRKAATLRHRF
jgi:hypothetical protein